MLKLKPLIAEKAKENLATHTKDGYKQPSQNSANPVDTRQELAKLSGVSHDTISRIEKIAAKAKENLTLSPGRGKKGPQNSANLLKCPETHFLRVVKVILPLTLKTFIVGHSMKSLIAHPGKLRLRE